MSTTATTVPSLTPHDVSLGGAIRSEWIKLRSIRSTWWSFGILVALTVGLGAQLSAVLGFEGVTFTPSQEAENALAVYATTVSLDFGALVISVLGVLVIAGEYGTGMIRSTLTAVPDRLPALLAKALVFAGATVLAGALTFALTVPISLALLSANGVDVDLNDPQYWLSLIGAVGYLVLVGLIAFSIGAIIRNTAGGIAVAIGLVLAAPIVWSLITGFTQVTWIQNIGMMLPSNLGRALFTYPEEWAGDAAAPETPTPEGLWTIEPWQGGIGLVVWVAVLFTAAAVLLKRRDA